MIVVNENELGKILLSIENFLGNKKMKVDSNISKKADELLNQENVACFTKLCNFYKVKESKSMACKSMCYIEAIFRESVNEIQFYDGYNTEEHRELIKKAYANAGLLTRQAFSFISTLERWLEDQKEVFDYFNKEGIYTYEGGVDSKPEFRKEKIKKCKACEAILTKKGFPEECEICKKRRNYYQFDHPHKLIDKREVEYLKEFVERFYHWTVFTECNSDPIDIFDVSSSPIRLDGKTISDGWNKKFTDYYCKIFKILGFEPKEYSYHVYQLLKLSGHPKPWSKGTIYGKLLGFK